jgi:hypothetical protein
LVYKKPLLNGVFLLPSLPDLGIVFVEALTMQITTTKRSQKALVVMEWAHNNNKRVEDLTETDIRAALCEYIEQRRENKQLSGIEKLAADIAAGKPSDEDSDDSFDGLD